MGVCTAADEAVDNAKDLLDDVETDITSIEELLETALNHRTWGATDYTEEHRADLANMLDDCRAFRRKINNWLLR